MLVASDLVFVHIPRTGGSFIRGVLRDHLEPEPSAPRFATHAAWSELPRQFRDRPAFCVVRNPWDWYVSWYHHLVKSGPRFAGLDPGHPKRANWETAFEGGRSTFKEAVTTLCEGRLEHPFADAVRRRDADLYTEYVRTLAGRAIRRDRLEPGRFERLIPFTVEFLDRHALLTDPLRDALEQSPPTNATEHGPYRDYYDDELRELVAHKSRWLTERFEYEF
jgi:Sulfotransferase domain